MKSKKKNILKNMNITALLLIITTVAIVIALATPTSASNWPLWRNDYGNTGESNETINLPLTLQWHTSAPSVEENGVVVSNGIAYMSTDNGYLYAFDVSTGSTISGFPVSTGLSYGTPAVDEINGIVYALTRDSTLYAFYLNGTLAWSASVGSVGTNYFEGPIIDDEYIYFKSGGYLRKYNHTGSQQWASSTGGSNTQPAIMGEYVYVNTESGQIRKYNKTTGTEITGGGFPISTSSSQAGITTINEKIFHKGSILYAYNAYDGSLIWSQSAGGDSTYYGSPAVSNGVVYVYGWDGYMYAFNENNGSTMDGFPSDFLGSSNRNWGSPTVAGDKVFIGAGETQELKVLGAAGTPDAGDVLAEYLTFSDDPQGFDLCSPVISNGVVFAMLDGGGLYAFYGSGVNWSGGAIIINNGNNCTTTRNVTITLDNGTNSDVVEMRISEDPLFGDASWEPFNETKLWTLSEGYEIKTVYAQFKDSEGQLSSVYNDQIEYAESCGDDSIPPVTYKTVGYPKYGENEEWINLNTWFNLTADDGENGSGVQNTYYRIWWNESGNWTDLTGIVTYEGNFTIGDHHEEECQHKIEFWSVDNSNNEEQHQYQTHYVDNTGPNQTIEFGEPKNETFYYFNGSWYMGISGHTTVWINSTDVGCMGGVGSDHLSFEVFLGQEFGEWEIIEEVTVYDNDTDDSNPEVGKISYEFYLDESCWHEIHYWCYDKLGNRAPEPEDSFLNIDFIVDADPPVTTRYYTEPKYGDYISCSTMKIINATDIGCIPGGSGVWKIDWKVDKHIGDDIWVLTKSGTVYDNDNNDTNPKVGEIEIAVWVDEDCEHHIYDKATDYFGNVQAEHKEYIKVDCTPPEINKTVGDPNCTGCNYCETGDYCVTTHTNISFFAEDKGCLGGVGLDTVMYRIWNGEWGSWIYDEEFDGEWFYFEEECMHYLEIVAIDLLGNMVEDNETFYVDDKPPMIIKKIESPIVPYNEECDSDLENGGFESNLTGWTIISSADSVSVVTADGFTSPFTGMYMARLGDDNEGGGSQPIGDNKISQEFTVTQDKFMFAYNLFTYDYASYDIFEYSLKTADGLTTITEHYQTSWGNDSGLKTTGWIVVSIDVSVFIGEELNFTINCGGTSDNDLPTWAYVDCATDTTYWINCNTPIIIDAYDMGCCDNLTYVGYNINNTGWVEIPLDELPKTIYLPSCNHTFDIKAMDCLGNTEYHNETFYVDCTPPEINKTVGEPKCTIIEGEEYCVTTQTPIDICAEDLGCMGGIGLEELKYRIWNVSDGWGDWIYIIEGCDTYYFIEECMHYLEIVATDYLGNTAVDNETFYVDETYPIIEKTVGDPNCTCDMDVDYCVTTQTPITIFAYDPGCCSSLTVEYRVWNDTYDSGWIEINVSYDFYFTEECFHHLDIRAYDCLGHMVYDNETFFVDDTPPEIIKTVGEPNCSEFNGGDYCVTTQTEISIEAHDQGCCPCTEVMIEYRIWYNGSWSDWTMYVEPFTFDEECMHYLEINATDCLGNSAMDNETFYVDDTPPEIDKTVGDPNCFSECTEGDYCVTTETEITVEAYDLGCCPCENVTIDYRIWFNGTWTFWTQYTEPITLDEECMHYLELNASDCLGNFATDNETFYVDDTPPVLVKTVGEPSFTEDNETWWVTTETEINLSGYDMGCCPCPNVWIKYRIWYQGHWTDWMNYTGNFTFERGCTHYLEVNISDCLGNYIIDNETFIVHGPGGDSDPNIEIIYPEFGSTHCERTVKVIINATDDLTSWEDLVVSLWIPGGRRDAPDLWYDVYLGDEENQFVAYVDIYNYQAGAQITLYATAEDEDGNVGFAMPVKFTVCSTTIWDQWMQEGWNLLILPPDIGCNESVERVMSSVNGSYDFVFYYDSSEGWISYWTEDEENELKSIEGGKQYWVHITNENGIRYYIGLPEIDILNPEDDSVLEYLYEINGTAWNSQEGIEGVHLWIYYKDESNNKHYWDGIDWIESSYDLMCELDNFTVEYIQNWHYDSSSVDWICAETFYIRAIATDEFGCLAIDQISFDYVCIEECDPDKTYTLDEDFNEGEFVGGMYAEDDQLQLALEETLTYPTLWIANAGEDSLSKWDTDTNEELARYHTWFGPLGNHGAWSGPAPSRTCVDSDGNCYVANRDFDDYTPDVIKVYTDDWIDRNGDGFLNTSYDANDNGEIEPSEMLPMTDSNSNGIIDDEEIVDERIAWATQVGSGGRGRSLAIDLDGNIWLGLYDTYQYYKIDSEDGSILGGPYSVGNTPYGALVDKYGYLWGSSLSSSVLKMNTSDPTDTTTYYVPSTYGIALGYDSVGNTLVYCGGNSPFVVFNSSSESYSYPTDGFDYALAVAVDSQGNIVVGSYYDGSVAKYAPDTTIIWEVAGQVNSEIRGIVVDSNDNIWAVHRDTSKLCKYNGSDGGYLGVYNAGLYPYTYSDATGIGYSGSVISGKWNAVHDSMAQDTIWNMISWNDNVPENTNLTVKVRSSNDMLSWSPWETAFNGMSLGSTPDGQYMEIEVSMKIFSGNESPILYDITIDGTCAEVTEENMPPEFSNEVPSDGSTDVSIELSSLSLDIEDPEGDSFNWSIETSPDVGSSSGSGVSNGTKMCSVSGLGYDTVYTWWVNASDVGSGLWTMATYTFTTESEPEENMPPEFSNEEPMNGSTDISMGLSSISVDIMDPEGDSFDWTIETSPDIGNSSGTGESDGTKTCLISGLDYNTTYSWYVNATDVGSGMWTMEIYTFTTEENLTMAIMGLIPSLETVNVGDNFTISVYIDPTVAVGGWAIWQFNFSSSLVNANEVTPGSGGWEPLFFDSGEIDNTNGSISGIECVIDNSSYPYPDFNHTACEISFTAISSGICTSELIDVEILATDFLTELDVVMFDTSVTIIET